MRKLKHKEAAPILPGVHNLWVSLVGSELGSPSLAVPVFNHHILFFIFCVPYFCLEESIIHKALCKLTLGTWEMNLIPAKGISPQGEWGMCSFCPSTSEVFSAHPHQDLWLFSGEREGTQLLAGSPSHFTGRAEWCPTCASIIRTSSCVVWERITWTPSHPTSEHVFRGSKGKVWDSGVIK